MMNHFMDDSLAQLDRTPKTVLAIVPALLLFRLGKCYTQHVLALVLTSLLGDMEYTTSMRLHIASNTPYSVV
jgi:hypothetical protein